MAVVVRRHITAEEFRKMAEAGVFGERDRLELIRGEIVTMTPIGQRHAGLISRLIHLITPQVTRQATVSVQGPLRLPGDHEVYPDFMLLRYRHDDYTSGIPTASDVLLVVEVADTSLVYDRTVKAPVYAQAGIPELWLLDISEARLWVYRRPHSEMYLDLFEAPHDSKLSPFHLPDVTVAVGELLR
jgi:Uma2 family endonuclease